MNEVLKQILGPGGALVLALFILFGGFREWWVYGKEYRRVLDQSKKWEQLALRGTHIAERVVSVAEKDADNGSTPKV
jgi:hypothetical protein